MGRAFKLVLRSDVPDFLPRFCLARTHDPQGFHRDPDAFAI